MYIGRLVFPGNYDENDLVSFDIPRQLLPLVLYFVTIMDNPDVWDSEEDYRHAQVAVRLIQSRLADD